MHTQHKANPGFVVVQKADLWSCGVILYALLYGRYPFDASEKHYARKIVRADYTFPEHVPVSEECKVLMQRLLVPEPSQRMCMEEILVQPWFGKALPEGALEMNDFYLGWSAPLYEVSTRSTAMQGCSVDTYCATSVHRAWVCWLQMCSVQPVKSFEFDCR